MTAPPTSPTPDAPPPPAPVSIHEASTDATRPQPADPGRPHWWLHVPTHQAVTHLGTWVAGLSGSLLTAARTQDHSAKQSRSPLREDLRRFAQNPAAMTAAIVVGILVLAAIFAPFLHTSNPTQLDYNAINQGPSWKHWFGTDPIGRDQYTRLLYGLRVPFMVGFAGALITLVVSMALGLAAGYYGGPIDTILGRFTDFMFAFPAFLLCIIVVTLFGSDLDAVLPAGVGRAVMLTVVFALVSWPPLMRFVRSLALNLRDQQFVEAARGSGTRGGALILRHLTPNVMGLVLVQVSLTIAAIIGSEAVLSIIGLGVQEPLPDLGTMLYEGAQNMQINPWSAFFPSAALTILIVSFSFIGDGIRDAVDPRGDD